MEDVLARKIATLKLSLSEAMSVEMLIAGRKSTNVSKMLAAITRSDAMAETTGRLIQKYGRAAGEMVTNDVAVDVAPRKYSCQSCGFAIFKGEKMVTFKRSHLCLFCSFMSLINAYDELESNLAQITGQLKIEVPSG